ncbi:MAG: sulfotransferase family 2 domain-containing protein [Wenzhouxiangellaceae bacterium]|nr:sulfotransferase family 2 domain-containing protein [Wenzhouxiangellaceae bacterium]
MSTPGLFQLIISHRHRFIFMHCRKVAGSTIAACLAPWLGPDDLHLGTWPEALRQGVMPNRRAWADLRHPLAAASFGARLLRRPNRLFDRTHQVGALNGAQRLKYRKALGPSPEHACARAVRDLYPQAWEQYFKFCFVRNPFDRAFSDYRWRVSKVGNDDLTFGQFLEKMAAGDFRERAIPRQFDNWPIYTIDNSIAVDFVGRFERLETDLKKVFDRIGLPMPAALPHAKSMQRKHHYSRHYGDHERQLVDRLFKRELAEFDYRFDYHV